MSRTERRKEQEHRNKVNRSKWVLLLIIIGSAVLFYLFGPSLDSPFQREQLVPDYTMLYNDEPGYEDVLIREGVRFIPVNWVKDHVLTGLEVLEEREKARWTPRAADIRFTADEVTELTLRATFPVEVNLLREGNELFFPLSGVEKLLGLRTEWHPETQILTIDEIGAPIQQGLMINHAALRTEPGRRQITKTELKTGETVRILETLDDYYRIRSGKGLIGYLSQSDVENIGRYTPSVADLEEASPSALPSPFGIVWDYVGNSHPDRSGEPVIEALSVYSPTWFELKNPEGELDNSAQFRYAKSMKDKGYQLWGLVTNAFDPDLTEQFMQNETGRHRFISQLLVYASLYELDGINIDFENIHYRNQDLFTDFVRELSDALRMQNLIVSIDVTIPGGSLNWSQVYDRTALEPHVDYFAVMTYDEHWGSSPVAGSVASIGWVERGIAATLEEVPAEKILLGLPFYTRLWTETPRAGGVSVTSRAMGMQFIRNLLEENDITEEDWEWDLLAGQYYAEYSIEGVRYRVWLEEERSIALKASLIEQYELAGFAAWRKGFEIPEIWDVLEEFVKTE